MENGSRRMKRRGLIFAPLSFLLALAAVVFGFSVFFRVHIITVSGNSRYTEEEIISASGIEQGDNLLFINRGTMTARINTHLPYVERATIRRRLPNRLDIQVTESSAIALLDSTEGTWVIDRNCKLLAEADSSTDASGLIAIDGLTAADPEVGAVAVGAGSDGQKIAYLQDILTAFSELGMQSDVSSMDFSNPSSPTFRYLDRFTVRLGPNEDLDYKFQLLLSAVARMSEGDRGTLDLSIDHRVHLTYE
ncbi:MAG: FtsQ-type POTRA domain-containing protein [Oscillospiraceae bacterium]|nr:FtsQ-type POTRA domain-containing protein [Oscillospiraceae bacterium]